MTDPAHTATEIPATIYWLATAIFVVSYALIVSEKVHRTKVALMGAALTIALPILTQHEAFHSVPLGIDYNVIFLLISMMIIVNVMARSGVLEWAAIRSAKLAKGRPFPLMAAFAVLTAIASAVLDNVTTVLVMAPVTLLIAEELVRVHGHMLVWVSPRGSKKAWRKYASTSSPVTSSMTSPRKSYPVLE